MADRFESDSCNSFYNLIRLLSIKFYNSTILPNQKYAFNILVEKVDVKEGSLYIFLSILVIYIFKLLKGLLLLSLLQL